MFIFDILFRILCRPEVWNSWTPESGFPPLWCFPRHLLQLTSVIVCLKVFLPLVLSSESKIQSQSGWNQEIDLASAEYSTLLPWKNSWVVFAVCFGSLSTCTMRRRPINFAPYGWIWADSISLYTSEVIRLLLSSVTSSINTSNPVPPEAMHAHAITLLTMFHRWCCMLWIMSCSEPSTYLFLPVILVQVDLNFSCPKNAFPEMNWLF